MAAPAEAFVERFAAVMVASGMPRMASRVLALLLSRDSGAGTAADLAADLQASPAAISGAVRYLISIHMVARVHPAGERRDVYRLVSDHWYEIVGDRDRELRQWARLSEEGADQVGPDTPAGRRLAETARFFDFVNAEMSGLLSRWREHERDR